MKKSRFNQLLDEIKTLHQRKGHDYGSSIDDLSNFRWSESMDIPAWKGCLIRISDKFARLLQFAKSGELKVKDETIIDTLRDLAVYSLLCIELFETRGKTDQELIDERFEKQTEGRIHFQEETERDKSQHEVGFEPWCVFEFASAKAIASQLLFLIGEDPGRAGLKDTPERIAKMWEEVFRGYGTPPPDMTTFETSHRSMVVKSGISVFSHCEHHASAIIMKVNVGYIPDKRVVGISKIIRLAEWCGARLIIQEEYTDDLADRLEKCLKPKGVIIVVQGRHLCEEARGVKSASKTTTSAIRGVFLHPDKEGLNPIEEFLHLCNLHSNSGNSI